jgi:hypothetical protein
MATTPPTRVDADIYATARSAALKSNRSTAQQISYWARIGRELDRSTSVSVRDIEAVLDGRLPYDGLDPREQAVVRAEWSVRMDAARERLDLATEFTAQDRAWVEADDEGNVVHREPDHTER